MYINRLDGVAPRPRQNQFICCDVRGTYVVCCTNKKIKKISLITPIYKGSTIYKYVLQNSARDERNMVSEYGLINGLKLPGGIS